MSFYYWSSVLSNLPTLGSWISAAFNEITTPKPLSLLHLARNSKADFNLGDNCVLIKTVGEGGDCETDLYLRRNFKHGPLGIGSHFHSLPDYSTLFLITLSANRKPNSSLKSKKIFVTSHKMKLKYLFASKLNREKYFIPLYLQYFIWKLFLLILGKTPTWKSKSLISIMIIKVIIVALSK